MGEISKTMAVGRARISSNLGCIEADGSWVHVNDELIFGFVVPFGNIFMGFTAATYGFPSGSSAFWPAHHPTDQKIEKDGSDQAFSYEFAYNDLSESDAQSETNSSSSLELKGSNFHFVGVIGASGTILENSDPESIIPALQAGVDSKAGSKTTSLMEEGSDSDESTGSDFIQKSSTVQQIWQQ